MIGPILLMSGFATIINAAFVRILVNTWGIPTLTFPFVFCVLIWTLGASGNYHYFPLNGAILQPNETPLNPMIWIKNS